MSKLESKVLGSLVGASAGDAMGATTELRTIEQIKADFDGWVTSFMAPPQDTFGRCNDAGMVTDDFTQGKFILEAVLDNNGEVSDEALRNAFRRWMDHPFYPNFTGPTTRASMQRIFVSLFSQTMWNLHVAYCPFQCLNRLSSRKQDLSFLQSLNC